jgi:hypothetical protein
MAVLHLSDASRCMRRFFVENKMQVARLNSSRGRASEIEQSLKSRLLLFGECATVG